MFPYVFLTTAGIKHTTEAKKACGNALQDLDYLR